VAIELKPMPNASFKSSSHPTRLRAIPGELVPDELASRTPNDDLNRSIEGSIVQASVMWLLHRRLEVVQDRGSLEQEIVQFSSAVFDAIVTSCPMLRKAGQERLWLIYFKALLKANTHRHEEMVLALRNVACRIGFGGLPPPSKGQEETMKSTRGHASDVEVLNQIARSLEQNNSSFET
jgi:hypothetical protein